MTDVANVFAKLLPATSMCPGKPSQPYRLLVNQNHQSGADRNPDDSGRQRIDHDRFPPKDIKNNQTQYAPGRRRAGPGRSNARAVGAFPDVRVLTGAKT